MIFFLGISDCSCAGKMPPGYILDHYNSSLPFNPIATNGEPFPWFLPNLPNNVRPLRYTLTIHPNLTTLDVKGMYQTLSFINGLCELLLQPPATALSVNVLLISSLFDSRISKTKYTLFYFFRCLFFMFLFRSSNDRISC